MHSLTALAFRAHMRRLALSKRPILVGPYRSELGFEALYWLPFLRKAITRYGINPERLITVTRGGAGVLYGVKSVDLYSLRTVEQIRLENAYDHERTKLQKQMDVTAWDRTVLKEAAERALGRGTRYHVLHPSWMYRLLSPWWDGQQGPQFLDGWADYQPLPKPNRPPIPGLPQTYVAMKWYDRVTWPCADPRVQSWMSEIVSTVGAQTPIVVLHGTEAADDHADVRIKHPAVFVPPVPDPKDNLAQQLRILAHAQAFIGTYGGLAQTALRLGVPSVSFWREFGGTADAHLQLSGALARKTGTPFLSGSIEDGESWRKVIGGIPLVPKAEPIQEVA
ncbi:MAG: hypothetical protein AB7P99_04650 [Vicinamibacterales bacterium]